MTTAVLQSKRVHVDPIPSSLCKRPRTTKVVRQAADNANGCGGLSDLVVLPGQLYTVFRRVRPTFSTTTSMLQVCDVDAPVRRELSTETLTFGVHTTPIRQFSIGTDRPNYNYASTAFDGTDQPRIYFSVRNNTVVDCVAVGCNTPSEQVGWVCEMINEVCSCRIIPDRDFVVVLRKTTDPVQTLHEQSLVDIYGGVLESSRCELREFSPTSRTLIPTRNLWHGMMTGRFGPSEAYYGAQHRTTGVYIPQPELLGVDEIAQLRSVGGGDNEQSAYVFVPLKTELGFDTSVRCMAEGSIVISPRPEILSFLLVAMEDSGLRPYITVDAVTKDNIERAIAVSDSARVIDDAKRFTYQWLDISCSMDALAENIAELSAPPAPHDNWSAEWISSDPVRQMERSIAVRSGSLGIATFNTCFPVPFRRFGEHVPWRSTFEPRSLTRLSKRGVSLAGILGRPRYDIQTLNTRLSQTFARQDGRPAASQYEALAGLVACSLEPIEQFDHPVLGMPIKSAVYPNKSTGVAAAYNGITCVNDLCRECGSFLYTVAAGSVSGVAFDDGPFVVHTEPVPAGSQFLHTFIVDPKVPDNEKLTVLTALRLILEWAYDTKRFLHGKLNPAKTILVGQPKTVRTSLVFSDGTVGRVDSQRQVYVVDYSTSTYSDVAATTNLGTESFKTTLKALGLPHMIDEINYTRSAAGSKPPVPVADRLPSELYMYAIWGSSLIGAIRRYANRILHGRVPWIGDPGDLGVKRRQEINAVLHVLRRQVDDDAEGRNLCRVLEKISLTCGGK